MKSGVPYFAALGVAFACAVSGCREKMAVEAGCVVAERSGLRVAAVVVPANASPAQRYAAEELRDFTEKMTGRRKEIQDEIIARLVASMR